MRARLRFLSIAVPLVGLAVLYLVRLGLLRIWPVVAVDAALGFLITAGVLAFSWAIFRVIARQDRSLARQHAELERRYETERRLRAQLEALHQAALAIASAQTPAQILQRLVDLARELIGARYAALGVLSPQGAIDDFYTAGISAEERARIGPLPQGHGLLGVTLTAGASLRLPDIARDPARSASRRGTRSCTACWPCPWPMARPWSATSTWPIGSAPRSSARRTNACSRCWRGRPRW